MSARFLQRFKFLAGAVFAFVVASTVHGQEFYKGKTLVFIVGTAPGGGFDTYSRITARHIGKHIPGNPSTIVQNMPGAGNLIAANYVYNKAEPDGLTVGHFSGSMIFKHILGDQGVMFDGKKFGWLGTPAPERHTCVLTEKTGIRNLEEWSAAKRPVKLASLGPGNATSALPQLLRAVLGLPINVVEVPIEVFGFVSQRFSISLSAFR
jgi:tripartite-type tricarboxylate transporter receptor subunit TctC